jgi:starch phosphorylase
MKAALNGALNLSVLDGWWDEWFDGENGWAIPTADGVDSPDRRDDIEAAALYDLIEKKVAPAFYGLDDRGLPWRWLDMVRHTLSTLGPKVLASRMVTDYVNQLYTPAAVAARMFDGADGDAYARDAAAWISRVEAGWPDVRVEHVETSGVDDSPQLGNDMVVRAFVALGSLTPDDVVVEVVHGKVDAQDRIMNPTSANLASSASYEGNRWLYETVVPLDRTGLFGYTVRILPSNPCLVSPAELGLQAVPVNSGTLADDESPLIGR